MSPFALLGPFQSRNKLFRPDFNFIFILIEYSLNIFHFSEFLKNSVFWGPLDAHRLDFRENPTVSKFNEI